VYGIEDVGLTCAIVAHEAVYAFGELYALLGDVLEVYYRQILESHIHIFIEQKYHFLRFGASYFVK
jgi:hypothetical protein